MIDLGDHPDLAGLPAPLGLDPAGPPRDERYALTVDRSGIKLRAREPAGVARGLTSLLQLIATATATATTTAVPLPALDILDAPRFAWRGLTLDLVRRFFPPAQIRTLIDLAALYKLDVLHLHLTDDQGWRVEAGRPVPMREPDGSFYTDDEVRALVAYAAGRFVTLLPEIDTPGHGLALLRLRPELGSGRNLVRPGQPHQSAWLDPELPATFEVLDAALAELAGLFPGPFGQGGGDEPYGMPDQAYGVYVRRLKQAARALGKRTVGWQESIRAGADPGHVISTGWTPPASASGREAPVAPRVTACRSCHPRHTATNMAARAPAFRPAVKAAGREPVGRGGSAVRRTGAGQRWGAAGRPSEVPPRTRALSPPVVAAQVWECLPQAAGRRPFGAVHQLEDSHREREVDWVRMLGPAVELAKFRAEVRTQVAHAPSVPDSQSRTPDAGIWGENQDEMAASPVCLSRYPAV